MLVRAVQFKHALAPILVNVAADGNVILASKEHP
jgi:hypothetical protein